MSEKKNYRAMHNKQTESVVSEDSSIARVEGEPSEEPKCALAIGIVTGCSRLNVRKEPKTDSEVICTVPVWSQIQICMTHEDGMWYHVYTAAGQEGYCMKQFIET